MSKARLILIGAGGHARACMDVIEKQGEYEIAGLVGTPEQLSKEHFGYPVIGSDNDLAQLASQYEYALITVGQTKSPALRVSLLQQALAVGFNLPTIISPSAHVSCHALVGAGSIVMHGAIINSGAKIGDNCIINTRTIIEHDAIIADNCHISTGAIVNGDVIIGSGSFIGSGSVVKQGINLGSYCVVGMGLAVRHDHPDNSQILSNEKS
jgi:sugar O-acyltransferase (sialic acid O-acetyltransferase NeuD family)